MKITALSLICIGLVAKAHGSPGLRAVPVNSHRDLQSIRDWPYAFLVSHSADEPWCIEAKHGTEDGKNIGLSPCNFDGNPDDQQWLLDDDGKIHSKLNPTRCLIVDDGIGVSSGNRILFADCNVNTEYNKFVHDKTTDQIKVKEDTSFCLKQVGNTPQLSDTVRTEPCTDQKWFTFDYKDDHSCPSKNTASNPDVECCSDSDCSGSNNTCNRATYLCSLGKTNTPCTTDANCNAGEQCINNFCEAVTPPILNPVFLVNRDNSAGSDWCVDASFGIGEFEEVGYELCDFVNKPGRQLWHMETDGTIRSHLDQSRCLVVGPGHDLYGGLKVRIASCALREFDYDAATGHIRLRGDNSHCLLPVGPPGGELMGAKTCRNEDKYKFNKQ